MTYTPEWPAKVTSRPQGLFQFQESTFRPKEKKPDQDALRQRIANLYAGKTRSTEGETPCP